jgi:hypothetical protein
MHRAAKPPPGRTGTRPMAASALPFRRHSGPSLDLPLANPVANDPWIAGHS